MISLHLPRKIRKTWKGHLRALEALHTTLCKVLLTHAKVRHLLRESQVYFRFRFPLKLCLKVYEHSFKYTSLMASCDVNLSGTLSWSLAQSIYSWVTTDIMAITDMTERLWQWVGRGGEIGYLMERSSPTIIVVSFRPRPSSISKPSLFLSPTSLYLLPPLSSLCSPHLPCHLSPLSLSPK